MGEKNLISISTSVINMASVHTNNPYSALQNNVNQALDELVADESVYVPNIEAEELFNLPDSVQIFFISDDKVSTFSQPQSLRVFRFKHKKEGEANTFIQVGGWTHPLGQDFPVLKAGNGSFMFPDAYGDIEGASVGLVICDESPYNVDGEAEAQLEQLLEQLTAMKKEDLSKDNTANLDDLKLGKYGKIIFGTAEKLGNVMEAGAEKGAQMIEYVTEKQKAKIQPAEQDTKMNAVVKTSVKGARYTTQATVKVSGFIANRVGKLTKSLANSLAKKIEPSVTGTVTTVSGGKKSKSSSMHNLIDAARGGLLAYGSVYSSLEDSAKVLGKSLKSNSVQVVQHKYGGEASEVYGEAMTAAGDAAMTYLNIQSLGVKGLVKKTAKDTGKQLGKAVLDAHVDKKSIKDQFSLVRNFSHVFENTYRK